MLEANRVYIASKMDLMEPQVRALGAQFKERGYIVPYDWTEHPVIKPFSKHRKAANFAAEKMARAVMECDIMVVLCAEHGLGYHIETGGALVTSVVLNFVTGQKRKRIFVVGPGNHRSIFYFHETVIRLDHEDLLWKFLPDLRKRKRA